MLFVFSLTKPFDLRNQSSFLRLLTFLHNHLSIVLYEKQQMNGAKSTAATTTGVIE
jgi:hypothetical protein